MSIVPHSVTHTEYRNGNDVVFSVEPGLVSTFNFQRFESLPEVEEYIAALRAASAEAKLPAERATAPSESERMKQLERLLRKAKGLPETGGPDVKPDTTS
jgi:hypothetical protein